MAYRGVKGSDPFVSKTSRNERFAQMSKQEKIIQQKKLEIQAKMQEMKAKQAVDNVKKNTTISNNSNVAAVTKPISTVKKEEEKPTSAATINLFANDGSFLDQFKKISNKAPSKAAQESSLAISSTSTLSPAPAINKIVADEVKKDERNKDERNSEKNHDNNSSRERRWNGDKNRDWECRRERRRNESRWSGRSSDRRRSSSSSPSPPRHRSSPSPADTRRYHTSSSNGSRSQFNQPTCPSAPPQTINPTSTSSSSSSSTSSSSSSSIPPLIPQPMMQLTTIPPPNLRSLPPNVPRTNHTNHQIIHHGSGGAQPIKNDSYPTIDNHQNNSRMPLPLPHMIRPPPPPPINTNIPPPTMTIPPNVTIQSPQQHIIPPPQSQCNISQLNNLQPPNIPPPNVRPPPSLLPPMSQMPPNMLQINSTQTIVVTVANVPPPQTVMPPPLIMSAPPPSVHTVVTSTINSIPPPNLNIPPPNVPLPSIIQNSVPPPSQQSQSSSTPSSTSSPSSSSSQQTAPQPSSHLLPTTYPIQNQVQMSVTRPNVQIPPPVRPPQSSLSSSSEHPGHTCPVEAEQLARIVADCGDAIEQEVREKNAQDPKLWFLHQKQSAAYVQYRGLVAKFRAEKIEKSNNNTTVKRSSGAEPYCPEEALSDNDDNDKITSKNTSPSDNSKEDSKEERKRKRRSRWSEPDNQVSITSMNIPPGLSGLNSHTRSTGINIPVKLGQSAVIIPPKTQNTKAKNPMLTKISRNDPALMQYARQTFGTLDLSEEQWKKAEDHFKINLLYQNLLKKREEVKRLESQGKHKYEYDSDEEIEGGTWEHKIRSAEMEATQMWAEELTAQAEGKHHIGDFLPPDELKKFMEQYNALKQGKEPDLSDYKEYKLKEDNIGFQMLQKLGWSEGQGLGSEGSGRVDPVNKATSRLDSSGLGTERPDGISRDDDEFDAYRKRMMLAYRFRPNPLNNPRRPYY